MENFNWTSFTRKIAVKAPLKTIYEAWTKKAEIEKWFLREAVFYDQNGIEINKTREIQEGYSYKWVWYIYDDVGRGEITAVNGKDFIQFTFEKSLVDVELQEQGDLVVVTLTQKNIPTDDQSKQNIRLGCHTGWSFYLVNLKSVFEGGLDLRNKDEQLGAMMNN